MRWPSATNTPPSPSGYRPDIDGLRAVAVMSVVLFHLGLAGLGGGYVGVDVFFVISGFLITQILVQEARDGHFHIARFYERRARRILPALFAMLAVATLAALILCVPSELKMFGKSVAATTLFSSNLLFWAQQSYFDPTATSQPLLHCWSLAVEEQFYIFYPLLLVVAFRLVPTRHGRGAVLAALALLSFVASVLAMHYHAEASAFYMMPLRGWELLAGALLAIGAIPTASERIRGLVAFAGLTLILCAVVFYTPDTGFPGLTAVPPVAGAAALIWAGTSSLPRINRLLGSKPAVFIGLISYSLYLWHWPLLVFTRFALMREPVLWERVALLGVCLTLAIVSWRFIETPFRRKQVFSGATPLLWSSAAVGGAFLAAGVVMFVGQGLPQRLSPYAQQVAAGVSDRRYGEDYCSDVPLVGRRGLCRIGADATTRDTLVWGDSHAWAMRSAFDAALKADHKGGYLADFVGCPPLFGVDRLNYHIPCRQLNDALRAFLATRRIKTVVIVASWRGVAGTEATTNIAFNDQPSTDAATRQRAFDAAFGETLTILHRMGLHTVFVMPIPGARGDVPNTLARADMLRRPVALRYDRADYDRQYAEISRKLAANAEDVAAIVPLQDLLCGDGVCEVIRNGKPLYFDDNHPTLTLNNLLAPQFAAQLKPYLGSDRRDPGSLQPVAESGG